jgi:hypothetical protein
VDFKLGSLIGQPLKDIDLIHAEEDYNKLKIVGLIFYDSETKEECKFVPEIDRFEIPYIRLIRTPVIAPLATNYINNDIKEILK